MSFLYDSIGSFFTAAESATLTYPAAPSSGKIAVACVDSGHPTATNIPTTPEGWAFVGTFVGGGGAYGADAGPRRLTFFIRALQGGDDEPTFTIPAGTDSRVGGAIVFLSYDATGQPVVRYQASFGEDTSSGTAFSVVGDKAIVWSSAEGQAVLLAYVIATDAFTYSAEAIAATGITYSAITERGDNASTVGADARRAIATGTVTAGGPAAAVPTVSATLSGSSTGVAGALRLEDRAADGGPATITATYDQALSRVRLAIGGLDPNATVVTVERSTNGVVWAPVRGGFDTPIGLLPALNDTFARTVVDGWGSADTGQAYVNTGGAAGDYDVAAGVGTQSAGSVNVHRLSTATVGTANAEAMVDVKIPVVPATAPITCWLFGRYTDGANWYAAILNIAQTTGVAVIQIGKLVANVFTVLATSATVGTHAANDTWRVKFRYNGSLLQVKAWKTTDVEPAAWSTAAVDISLTSGAGAGVGSKLEAGNTNGLPVVFSWDDFSVQSIGVQLDDYEFVPDVLNTYRATAHDPGLVTTDIETTTVTPVLDRIWLKSVTRPFLNRAWTVVGFTDPVRPSRSSEFDVVGRTLPVSVGDISGSRRWAVDLYTTTADDAQTLDYVLAAGDVMLLHCPRGCEVPGGYVRIKDYGQRHPAGRVRGPSRITSLPLIEVAPPGPDVGANISTWASVLAAYATWADVLAAFPTWADLLELVGDPSEVIVP